MLPALGLDVVIDKVAIVREGDVPRTSRVAVPPHGAGRRGIYGTRDSNGLCSVPRKADSVHPAKCEPALRRRSMQCSKSRSYRSQSSPSHCSRGGCEIRGGDDFPRAKARGLRANTFYCLSVQRKSSYPTSTLSARRRYQKPTGILQSRGPGEANCAELLSRLSRSRSARISAALWQRRFTSFSSALLIDLPAAAANQDSVATAEPAPDSGCRENHPGSITTKRQCPVAIS